MSCEKDIIPTQLVPVQIDSMKWLNDFQRTRCIYYRVEYDDGSLALPASLREDDSTIVYAWGSWAVLLGPGKSINNNDQGLFTSPESIDSTLRGIEETDGLTLDLGHIWLPSELFGEQDEDNNIRRGDVYRLGTTLFRQCYQFSAEMITEEQWLGSCKSQRDAIQPSKEETVAFRKWRREQIEQSKERYHSPNYAHRQLKKKSELK